MSTSSNSSQSPPYYSLALAAFDSVYWGLGWVAGVYYGNKITHPDLMGTMVATIGCIEFIIGKRARQTSEPFSKWQTP